MGKAAFSRQYAKSFIDALRPPAATYDEGVDLYLGSRQIRVRSFPGHTGGDSIVLIPDAKVVFAGDLFWRNMVPNMIDASTKSWIATLEALATSGDYVFVPGHGDLGTAQDVAAFREHLVTLQTLVSESRAQGKTGAPLAQVVVRRWLESTDNGTASSTSPNQAFFRWTPS